jgi:hypothetical protein
MTATKIANASAISRKLALAFDRSKETATRIRGWHDTTPGFLVSAFPKGVLVTWQLGSERRVADWTEINDRKRRMTDAMNAYLRANGYETQLIDGIGVAIRNKEQTDAN